MSHTAMYWLADKIGKETKLWNTKLIYGTNDSTWKEPIRKSDIKKIVEETNKSIFDKNGIIIMSVGINSKWNSEDDENYIPKGGKIAYYHFIVVLDMQMKPNGAVRMFIVDSMGSDHKGYFGWVNSEAYTSQLPYNNDVYTGIRNIYGLVPM